MWKVLKICFAFNLRRNIWNIKDIPFVYVSSYENWILLLQNNVLHWHKHICQNMKIQRATTNDFTFSWSSSSRSDLIRSALRPWGSMQRWFTVISIATHLKHTTTTYFLSRRLAHSTERSFHWTSLGFTCARRASSEICGKMH